MLCRPNGTLVRGTVITEVAHRAQEHFNPSLEDMLNNLELANAPKSKASMAQSGQSSPNSPGQSDQSAKVHAANWFLLLGRLQICVSSSALMRLDFQPIHHQFQHVQCIMSGAGKRCCAMALLSLPPSSHAFCQYAEQQSCPCYHCRAAAEMSEAGWLFASCLLGAAYMLQAMGFLM